MSSKDKVLDALFALSVGRDYGQPTSLERDMDALCDVIINAGLCEGLGSDKTYALSELLAYLKPRQDADIGQLVRSAEEMEIIIGDNDYGNIRAGAARALAGHVERFTQKFEEYINAIEI